MAERCSKTPPFVPSIFHFSSRPADARAAFLFIPHSAEPLVPHAPSGHQRREHSRKHGGRKNNNAVRWRSLKCYSSLCKRILLPLLFTSEHLCVCRACYFSIHLLDPAWKINPGAFHEGLQGPESSASFWPKICVSPIDCIRAIPSSGVPDRK